ncbi:MAG: hypothetical protein U0414_06315 [Polyangiaceae bacterium]
MTRLSRRFVLFIGVLFAWVLARPALAQSEPPELAVEAHYVFPKSAVRGGVNEIIVRLENLTDEPAVGRVYVSASMPDSTAAEAAYRLDAHARGILHLPVQVTDTFTAILKVEKSGTLVARSEIRASSVRGHHVVDLAESSHLFTMNGMLLPVATGSSRSGEIQVETPAVDAGTGDLVLPWFATGWAGVDLAVVASDRLARLDGVELESLSAFVLGGGTLAVNVVREEDCHSANLTALLGGACARALPRREQLRPSPTRLNISRSSPVVPPIAPGEATLFTSYAGGNLKPTVFGASAQYGLGRVVLLGFDLGAAGVADDPWVQLRLVEMLDRDSHSSTSIAVPGERGEGEETYGGPYRARRMLNPERGGNWGVALSAILLCIYAVIAGPIAFSRAKKQNRPLRALLWLPLFSAAMFLVIVAIGAASRGSGARARRMTFIDLGAGMDRGVGRRWRAILFSSSATFDAAPDRRTSFLRRTWMERNEGEPSTQLIDREGLQVKGVNVAPWETVLLREEGIFSVGQGVSVGVDEAGSVHVRNRTGRALKSVLVKLKDGTLRFFSELAPDTAITAPAAGPGERPSMAVTSPSSASSQIESAFLGQAGTPDAITFGAILDAVGRDVDWAPTGVPVVLALFDEPPGRSDAGAPIDWDRTVLRVVGVGGEP